MDSVKPASLKQESPMSHLAWFEHRMTASTNRYSCNAPTRDRPLLGWSGTTHNPAAAWYKRSPQGQKHTLGDAGCRPYRSEAVHKRPFSSLVRTASVLVLGSAALWPIPAALAVPLAQSPAGAPATHSATPAERSVRAVNYRRAGTTTKMSFHATDPGQLASGEAEVKNKGNRVEIEARFTGLEAASKFGLQ